MSGRTNRHRAPHPAIVALVGMLLGAQQAIAAASSLYSYTLTVGSSSEFVNSVLFDGHFIWVAIENPDGGAGRVARISNTGFVLSSTPVGNVPIEMAFDGRNVWVTDYATSDVTGIDPNG